FSYTAFYDLDHTILDGNSATHLVREARKRGVMSERQYRHAVWLSILYKLSIGDPTKMINRMLSWLKGIKEAAIMELSQEIFDNTIKETIRPEILETIQEHRAKNGAVVLLSSATIPICQPVTQYMELDEMICTHLESKNGVLTGHTSGKLVYGPEKKVRMLAFCRKKGYNPLKAWYYGDSHTDRYVMEAVGNPVAVSPDKRLLKIANRNNWPILVPAQ
ncbi:MAG: HAD-IB family hydrolase, partial [Bacteroidales bacterium]|nr:HAD-IB family hydrolase [Bacteroidales bacterium]